MTELLPCPFCGGEARIIAKPYEPKVCVGCDDDTCLGFSGLGWLYETEEQAAAAWNRRADLIEPQPDPTARFCSACGAKYPAWAELPKNLKYCRMCGAKVVDE